MHKEWSYTMTRVKDTYHKSSNSFKTNFGRWSPTFYPTDQRCPE